MTFLLYVYAVSAIYVGVVGSVKMNAITAASYSRYIAIGKSPTYASFWSTISPVVGVILSALIPIYNTLACIKFLLFITKRK